MLNPQSKTAFVVRWIKNMSLPLTMIAGVISYFIVHALPISTATRGVLEDIVEIIQPSLIFLMLFVSFCKIKASEIRPNMWHVWVALIQAGSFAILSLILWLLPDMPYRVVMESAIVCLICPTATAAAVINEKLGGKTASVLSYTIFINLVTAIMIPTFLPLIEPNSTISFMDTFWAIIAKVFPLLACPFIAAMLVRQFFPKFLNLILKVKDLAFYLWIVALALALAITTRAWWHSNLDVITFILMAFVTMICCLGQFYIGRKVGGKYGEMISGGQAMGQKNTVFMIWLAYTFMSPVTAIAGGFYSIWHNLVNSYQLYKAQAKKDAAAHAALTQAKATAKAAKEFAKKEKAAAKAAAKAARIAEEEAEKLAKQAEKAEAKAELLEKEVEKEVEKEMTQANGKGALETTTETTTESTETETK